MILCVTISNNYKYNRAFVSVLTDDGDIARGAKIVDLAETSTFRLKSPILFLAEINCKSVTSRALGYS